MKKISRSLLLSVFFHLLLVGALLFFANEFWKKEFSAGGGKGNSPVWVGLGNKQGGAPQKTSAVSPSQTPVARQKTQPTPHAVSITPSPQKTSVSDLGGEKNDLGQGGTPGASSAPGQGSGGGGGVGGGRDIKSEILRKIQRAKHYPALARARAWQGIVEVEFLINPSGNLEKLSVIQSSGFPVLDEEALATVRRAVPLPYYSSVLRVPIHFELEER